MQQARAKITPAVVTTAPMTSPLLGGLFSDLAIFDAQSVDEIRSVLSQDKHADNVEGQDVAQVRRGRGEIRNVES